jgi:hypothetical protein
MLSGPAPGWSIAGVGDLDRDGYPDLIWQEDASRAPGVWYMGGADGSAVLSTKMLSGPTPGWKVVGVADLHLDARPDLLWQEDFTGAPGVWYMGRIDGSTFLSAKMLGRPAPRWKVVAPL